MGDSEQAIIRVVEGLAGVDAVAWDACANPPGEPANPFVSHAFLSALEESGSATRRTGWLPQHLLLEDDRGRLAGAMPLYLKSHSRGEYVFDHGWANALENAGGRYYPKLQASVPFTPATGPRLLVPTGPGREAVEDALATGAVELATRLGVSSLHITFLAQRQWERLGRLGFLQRTDQQFHWRNRGYGSFDDFLADLSSRKRKMVRRERERAKENGITVEWVTGADLTEDHWDAFFAFYMDTGSRKWGSPYLSREFFSLIGERMAQETLLVMARRDGRLIAGALNFIGGDALYGRNWGALEHHPFLHFECCYYQAIEFAISRGLARVEAGAQGEHKLARGYLPARTHSAHWIANPSFREAVAEYLSREREYVDRDIAALGEFAPFRHDDGNNEHREDEF
ncbi:GNAT family N-acetyltransferase [Parvibaculum sp.]|uniref:GNAT family N-acetyltransferase n=1 Tax=Parvibaculum sp. TaxID=2024848 RepID=UPI001D6380CD|nr:GNAT family N-acetyltransferase [Parvibaculum sp.]MBX3488194.1 N-acetyltransferase [Parvibaculum sp.]MCW5727828.1 N-acetyltransferase [Parvibaculum sp.]